MKRILIILGILIVIAAAIWGGIYYKNKKNNENKKQATETTINNNAKVVEYDGEDGKTVFQILKDKYQVDSTDSSAGVLVNAIGSVKNTSTLFWLYSVNGVDATVSADHYFTKNDDKVKWEYKGF
ncbi:MAG: DUF4430 domain-containing protein [Candidatus Berkelbacteria bacterium]|nr:DUF4430 domain-containing protein [Candidatus Berkelbacteria bacterium]